MNWKSYWNKVALNAIGPIAAVQRKDMESTKFSASHIISTLKINKKDKVLDVCCGNGILTELIANSCLEITGIDQSEVLIKSSKDTSDSENISYILGDALRLTEVLKESKFDKIYLQFSFQYFDKKGMGEKVIKEMITVLKPNGLLFIGDIPEASKRFVFYNSLHKLFYFVTSKIRGKNSMGKFWSPKELAQICVKLNVEGTYIKQPELLPYAWYRFDYLIKNI
jgi:ubiquinone/menaquinone biosynthesis C-methylase UbiE